MKNCSNYRRVWSHRWRQGQGDNERQRWRAVHDMVDLFFFTPPAMTHGGWTRCFNILIGRRNGRFRDLAFYNDILCLTFRSSERVKPCSSRKSTTRNNLFCAHSLVSWTSELFFPPPVNEKLHIGEKKNSSINCFCFNKNPINCMWTIYQYIYINFHFFSILLKIN